MRETETIPTVITKWLNEYHTTFLSENRICYQYSRRKDGRRIALARRAGASGDGGDSDIRIPPCYCHGRLKPFKAGGSALRVTAVTVVTVILGYPAAVIPTGEHPVNAKCRREIYSPFSVV